MTIDLVSEDNHLYLSHTNRDRISVYSEDGELIDTFLIDAPHFTEIDNEFLYVISYTYYEEFNRVEKINGSNCIFVLDKLSHEIVNKIIFDWLQPQGLCFDDNYNIITVAYELDEDNTRLDSYLYVIDKRNYKILNKIPSFAPTFLLDMKSIDNGKVVFFFEYVDRLSIVKFEKNLEN